MSVVPRPFGPSPAWSRSTKSIAASARLATCDVQKICSSPRLTAWTKSTHYTLWSGINRGASLMKNHLATAIVLIGTLAGGVASSQAFSITTTIDENGNGSLTNTNGFNSSLPFALQNDPGPGGLPQALTYGLLNPPGLTAGDLALTDVACGGCIMDIIRFNPSESIAGTTGALVFYSNNTGSLADIGLPTAFYATMLSLPEIAGGAIYTPILGQPGFVANAGGPVTYHITSDSRPVPVPAVGAGLPGLIVGCAGLFGWIRRRKQAAA